MLTLDSEPESILIVKLSSIGDVIHALPVATALRRRFPKARISWLVSQKAREIVAGHPHLDQVFVVGKTFEAGEIAVPTINHPFQVAKILRASGFDIALDMQGLLRSSLFSFLSGAKIRIGYRSIREAAFLFYNVRTLPPVRDQHIVNGYLRFAALLDAPIEPVEFHIATNEEHETSVASIMAENGILPGDKMIALSPGSSWRAKTWPPDRMGKVAEYIATKHGYLPVMIGGKTDIKRSQLAISNCKAQIIDLTGKLSIKELTVFLKKCHAWVGNDSGPTHLAAALAVPVVAIYGPTDPLLLGPYGNGNITLSTKVECGPCRRRSLAERCSHIKCLTQIDAAQVCEAVDQLLSDNKGRLS